MNTASINRWGGGARLLRDRVPLHAWSRRRRAAVGGIVAAVACALATFACATTGFGGAAAAKAALASARRELAEAGRVQRALPALRRAASAVPRGSQRNGNSSDDARNVSELAAASEIALVSLAPDTPGGQGTEAFRVLKLGAQGDFARLRSFLHGLAHAPALIVPTETTIKRNGSQLSLAATLSVFGALPSPPVAAANDDAVTPPDPFATTQADGPRMGEGLRLAGLMQDRTHAVALIETSRGIEAVERGGRIEGERVMRIAMQEVTLAVGSATRALKWAEDGR